MIDCPYCLMPQSFNRSDNCESCGKKVPRMFIDMARVKPPIYIVTFGPSQHGKSTLLGSMSFLLERLGNFAPQAFHNYLDAYTTQRIADIQRGQQTGDPSLGATPMSDTPQPLIISLKNFPTPQKSQLFVIFDLAGEVVDKITDRVMDDSAPPPLYARAVAKAKTVWFIVSLYDMQRETLLTGKSINNLFWSYQQVMTHFNVPLRDRDILVIYTKADLLRQMDDVNQLEMPAPVNGYLGEDVYYDLGNRGAEKPPHLDYDACVTGMERISDELRTFTQSDISGGSAFVAMAEDSEAKLYFSIGSAQGSGATGTLIKRYRVLDPFIWSILLNTENDSSAAALILPTNDADDTYSASLPSVLFDRLQGRNIHPTTYFAGELRTAFADGSLPADAAPPTGRVPLVGPILDRLPPGSVAVVLAGKTLPIDIDDFAYTSWDDRLVLIGTDNTVLNARIRWKYVAKTPEELEPIIREFMRQLEALRKR